MKKYLCHQWGIIQSDNLVTDMYQCTICGEVKRFDKPPEFTCFECEETFITDAHEAPYTRDGEIVCDNCYDEGQSCCDYCGDYFEMDDLTYTDNEGRNQLCPECYAKWKINNA